MMKRLIAIATLLSITFSTAYATEVQGANMTSKESENLSSKSSLLRIEEEFLKANKSKAGVISLKDGLQYKVIKEGSGRQPSIADTVTVHYEGKLINGTEFDSSYKRGQPASFPVAGVIPGWREALQLMKEGSVWEIYIPSALAYGAYGAPPVIGPNEVLIFKVNLLSIAKK